MNTSAYEHIAKKIFKIIFRDEIEEYFSDIASISSHVTMRPPIVGCYSAEWESDDNFKYAVYLHTESSIQPNKIEAGIYVPIGDRNNDEWEFYSHWGDYSDRAKNLFELFTGKILEAYSSDNKLLFFRIATYDEKEIDFNCWKCGTGFIDNGIDKNKKFSDKFECPVCDTKLEISREIKIVYNISKI